jgi:sugar phosphate isomerase/epimerase
VSCCGNQNLTPEVFSDYISSGVSAMELSFTFDKYLSLDLEGIKRMAEEAGVELWSFHLPFLPFAENNIASLDTTVREKTVRYQTELIKKAAGIGINKMIIHPSGEPIKPEMRDDSMKYSCECLSILSREAKKAGAMLAVEDLPRTCLGNCSDDILKLISADENLRICFDMNHLLIQSISDFIRAVGDKIITIHVSDYDFINERHWIPGEGKINWVELLDLLDEVNYRGVFMYEVSLRADNIIREKDLTYGDFRRNYEELVERKPLTVLGLPNIIKK